MCIYRCGDADSSRVWKPDRGDVFEGAGVLLSQILITPKEEKKKATSKVQSVTGITIPDVVPNIKITLKFRSALL